MAEAEVTKEDGELVEKQKVGLTMRFKIVEETRGEILRWIRKIDGHRGKRLLPDELAMAEIRDYFTMEVRAPEGGSYYRGIFYKEGSKIRGKIANSLEQGLSQEVSASKYMWNTVLDKRTAKRDRELNGTEWRYDDPMAPRPPLHINCRCTRIPLPSNDRAYN